MRCRLLAVILSALLLGGCAAFGFSVRAGVNLPDGTEPYVEVHIDPVPNPVLEKNEKPPVSGPAEVTP